MYIQIRYILYSGMVSEFNSIKDLNDYIDASAVSQSGWHCIECDCIMMWDHKACTNDNMR